MEKEQLNEEIKQATKAHNAFFKSGNYEAAKYYLEERNRLLTLKSKI